MPSNPITFRRRLLLAIGRFGVRWVRPKIPSKTLRAATRFETIGESLGPFNALLGQNTGRIHVPHYWALFVHDGRLPFSMPFGHYMVWFKDPHLDPRLTGGKTPERASQLRHLTAEQFKEAVELGLVIVARRIRKATPPTPFFENGAGGGMFGFAEAVNQKFGVEVQGYIRDQIGPKLFQETDTAVATLQ